MTPIQTQPFIHFTIYQTAKGLFVIKQDNGNMRTCGETLEAAIRSAKNHFGSILTWRGTVAGEKFA